MIRAYDPDAKPAHMPKIFGEKLVVLEKDDLQMVEDRLKKVRDYLGQWGSKAKMNEHAKNFLPLEVNKKAGPGTEDLFAKVVADLTRTVDAYLDKNSKEAYFNVARGSTKGVLGSAVPVKDSVWLRVQDKLPTNATRCCTFVLQAGFTEAFNGKTLTDFGREMTLIHELTHGLLGTKDHAKKKEVKEKDNPYTFYIGGDEPKDTTPVLGVEMCLEFGKATSLWDKDAGKGAHMAWMNADSWAWALVSNKGTPKDKEFK